MDRINDYKTNCLDKCLHTFTEADKSSSSINIKMLKETCMHVLNIEYYLDLNRLPSTYNVGPCQSSIKCDVLS